MKQQTPEAKAAIDEERSLGEDVQRPLGSTLGERLDPTELPEDRLQAGADYVFGEDVAENFEELVISRQIPGYDEMRLRLVQLGHRFVKPNTSVLDIGTSRAKMIRDLIASFSALESDQPRKIDSVAYTGLDNEEPMLVRARAAVDKLFGDIGLSEEEAHRVVQLRNWDLRRGLPGQEASHSLITSVLTIQFVPMEYRHMLIQSVYDLLLPGGAFLWVEKTLGTNSYVDSLYTEVYHDEKRRMGLSDEAIVKKRESIEGFLVPQTSAGNREMLEAAGFHRSRIDTCWKNLQFEAYLAVK